MYTFKPFFMGFLMMASVLLQLFSPIMSASYMPQCLDYASPKKVSEALHSHSDNLSMGAMMSVMGFSGMSGNTARWQGTHGHRMEQAAHRVRDKAIKVERLAKQLDTNTVQGQANSPPLARTRSQTRKMTSS